MGSRANFVLVEGGRHRLFYSHWGAMTIPEDFFWGPEIAGEYVRAHDPAHEWLDDKWAEGGVLIDMDHHVLLLYGGQSLEGQPLLTRTYCRLLLWTWPGWKIRWAHEGVSAPAEHAGVRIGTASAGTKISLFGRLDSLIRRATTWPKFHLSDPDLPNPWLDTVMSVKWPDGAVHIYPICEGFDRVALLGPQVVRRLRRSRGLNELVLPIMPDWGAHLDPQTLSMDFWTGRCDPQSRRRAGEAWKGWSLKWHRDAFEMQTALTGEKLSFPVESEDSRLDQIAALLLGKEMGHPLEALKHLPGIQSGSNTISVSAPALRHPRPGISRETKEGILERALDAYRRGLSQ